MLMTHVGTRSFSPLGSSEGKTKQKRYYSVGIFHAPPCVSADHTQRPRFLTIPPSPFLLSICCRKGVHVLLVVPLPSTTRLPLVRHECSSTTVPRRAPPFPCVALLETGTFHICINGQAFVKHSFRTAGAGSTTANAFWYLVCRKVLGIPSPFSNDDMPCASSFQFLHGDQLTASLAVLCVVLRRARDCNALQRCFA